MPVGRRLWVTASPTAAPPPGRTAVLVTPGAFGSGEHVTTAGCLEFLEALPGIAGMRVLDVGSGTGILALAALLLGARHAVLVDTDPQAVATARRNGDLNGVSDRAEHVLGSLADAPPGPFDLVLANLHGDLLQVLAPQLAAAAAPGGWLILSGILWEDDFAVATAARRSGLRVRRRTMRDGYSTLLLQRGV